MSIQSAMSGAVSNIIGAASTAIKNAPESAQTYSEQSTPIIKAAVETQKDVMTKIASEQQRAQSLARKSVDEQTAAISAQKQAVEAQRQKITLRQKMKAEGATNKQIKMAYKKGGAE